MPKNWEKYVLGMSTVVNSRNKRLKIRGVIKKFYALYASVRFIVSWSFDPIEGHWECEKHAAMLGCLCKALLTEEDATHLQN